MEAQWVIGKLYLENSFSYFYCQFVNITCTFSNCKRSERPRQDHFSQVNNQLREQWASSFCLQVPVFLMQAKLGFRPGAGPMSYIPGAPRVPGPCAYAAVCSEVPEVFRGSI